MTTSSQKSKSKNPEIEQIATELDQVAAELAVAKDVFGAIIQTPYGDSIVNAGSAFLQNQVERVDELCEKLRALSPASKLTLIQGRKGSPEEVFEITSAVYRAAEDVHACVDALDALADKIEDYQAAHSMDQVVSGAQLADFELPRIKRRPTAADDDGAEAA